MKFEYTADCEEGMTRDRFVTQLNDYVQNKIIEIIEASANTVMNYSGGK